MSERRRALGRGLGALIPSGPSGTGSSQRPVDVFFQDREATQEPDSERPEDTAGTTASAPSATSPEAGTETETGAAAEVAIAAIAAPSTSAAEPASASEALLAELETGAATGTDRVSDADTGHTTTAALADIGTTPPALATSPSGGSGPTGAHVAGAATGDDHDDDGDPGDVEMDGLRPVPGARFAEIPVAAVHPNAKQPRQVFDDDELNELAGSIREVGVLQPVVVRPSGTDADGDPTYELIMGERRWRASRIAGNTAVPAIIRSTGEQDMLRDALLENLHRANLNPLEEAAAYQQLLDDFGCTHDELAVRIARSRPQISNTLRLLKLPPLVQRRVAAGVLSAGHARALLGLTDGAAMERLAQRIVAEGLSVRATEEIVTLGDDPLQPELRRRPRAGAHSAALNDLAARLSDDLDTKVKVNLGQRKGHVTIEFASVQDLNRILGVLVPKDPGVLREPEAPVAGGASADAEGAVDVGE